MAFPLHHCHRPLACRVHTVQWSWEDRTAAGDTVKQSQRRLTSPTPANSNRYEAADRGMFVDARSKMFRQHLKCSLTEKLHQDVQEQAPDFFFASFYSASCLTLGVLVQRCLGQPVDLLSRHDLQRLWYLANCRLLFIFRYVERRVQRNLEGLANVCLDELTVAQRHWLFF